MSNPAVTNQPGTGGFGTNVQMGPWSTDRCSCCADMSICAAGCFCPSILACYMADKYGEHCCLGFVPGGLTALRTHMRLTYGIEGTVCNDALVSFFCAPCELCRMARELRIRSGET